MPASMAGLITTSILLTSVTRESDGEAAQGGARLKGTVHTGARGPSCKELGRDPYWLRVGLRLGGESTQDIGQHGWASSLAVLTGLKEQSGLVQAYTRAGLDLVEVGPG